MKEVILLINFLVLFGTNLYSQEAVYNVKDFGEIPNGTTLCTKSVQKAIDKCAENGGGKVIILKKQYKC